LQSSFIKVRCRQIWIALAYQVWPPSAWSIMMI